MFQFWRHIFNASNAAYGRFHDLNAATMVAWDAGYKFLSWNGRIYFLVAPDYSNVQALETGITVEEINR